MNNIKVHIILTLALVFGFIENANASLAIHPIVFRDTLLIGQSNMMVLHITNVGPSSSLAYTVSENVDWLSATPLSGQLAIKETVGVILTFDASMLSAGEYTTTLTIGDPHHGPIEASVVLVVESLTDIKDEEVVPEMFSLKQNYPNPFNPSTSIRYSIPKNGFVSLKVYTLLGKEAATLVNGIQSAGVREIQWRADALPSGVYIYRLKTEEFSAMRRMSFIK